MSAEIAIQWVDALLGLGLVLSTLEILALRKHWVEGSVWSWSVLRKERAQALGPILEDKKFLLILVLQLLTALALLVLREEAVTCVLVLTQALVMERFRGSFNGGSDRMFFYITGALALGCIFDRPEFSLFYIGLQVLISYLVPGLQKLFSREWRSGAALSSFLASTVYETPIQTLRYPRLASYGVIFFELAAILAFGPRPLCVAYLVAGAGFHLANFYFLGLNRFFFAWIATYPAIYFCSEYFFH